MEGTGKWYNDYSKAGICLVIGPTLLRLGGKQKLFQNSNFASAANYVETLFHKPLVGLR